MLFQGYNREPLRMRVKRIAARTRADTSLTALKRRIVLLIGGIALWFLVAPLGASAQHITVRLINAKSGKPLREVPVTMFFWNGPPTFRPDNIPKGEVVVHTTTDAKGQAVFHMPEAIPEHIGFSIGGPRDFVGCWRQRDLSLEAVIRSGVVADYNESKCGKLRTKVSAEPGEVVIVDKKLTLRDQMRQEIP
jgi:hypothetical protein